MDTLIIPQSLVPKLLPMAACIDAMEKALRALAQDDAVLPLRSMVWMPDRSGLLGLMPAYLGTPRSLGLKVISYLPGNHGGDRDSHQGAVLLFDTSSGQLLAMIDASSITAIRTAAVSGLATRLLARAGAGDLAILGSGVQAATHLEAMSAVRKLRRVRVCSASLERAQAFARRYQARCDVPIEAMAGVKEAVAGPTSSARRRPRASRSCTATGSPTAPTSTPSARASRAPESWILAPSYARACTWTDWNRPLPKPATF